MLNRLFEDYLETALDYKDVSVKSFNMDGHICNVHFRHVGSDYPEDLRLDVWDVLAYVHLQSEDTNKRLIAQINLNGNE